MRKIGFLLIIVVSISCSKSENESPDPKGTNTSPSVPSKTFPTSGLLCADNPLDFKWEPSTDPEGDDINYEIEIAKDELFTDMVEKVTLNGTETTIYLEKGVELNWRIRAKDSKGAYSNYSPVWKFYTESEGIINYLPFSPSLVYPTLNAQVSESNVNLAWLSSDVDGDTLSYDIYFGEDNPPILLIENVVETSYKVTVLEGNTYYWKIVAKDNRGGESIGQIWNFKS